MREGLHNLRHKLTGAPGRANFNKAVGQEMGRGATKEEGRHTVLRGSLGAMFTELQAEDFPSSKSERYKLFRGGLEESFQKTDIERMQRAASDPSLFRPLAIAPRTAAEAAKDIKEAKKYLENRFKGATINPVLAADYNRLTRELEVLLPRTNAELARYGTMADAGRANPGIFADIGRVTEIYAAVEMHEKHIQRELEHHEAKKKLKETAKASLFNFFIAGPAAFFSALEKVAQKPTLGNFLGVLSGPAIMGSAVGKLLFRGAKSVRAAARRT